VKELSKSIHRRLRNPNFISKYFKGSGIDIGGFPDPLTLYKELFPLVSDIKIWDLQDGDAQFMNGVPSEYFDFVVSSHCLEHLVDPSIGLKNWFRILKPNGYLVVTIPDEDLYEQGYWPSTRNLDHKWTFTVWKPQSWSPKSMNVIDLLVSLGEAVDIRSVHVEDSGFRYKMPNFDQTLTPTAESAIEFIVRKKTLAEIQEFKSLGPDRSAFNEELSVYLNQYVKDARNLKSTNNSEAPFSDKTKLV
jgi:SAM-dependent methyltransferase